MVVRIGMFAVLVLRWVHASVPVEHGATLE